MFNPAGIKKNTPVSFTRSPSPQVRSFFERHCHRRCEARKKLVTCGVKGAAKKNKILNSPCFTALDPPITMHKNGPRATRYKTITVKLSNGITTLIN